MYSVFPMSASGKKSLASLRNGFIQWNCFLAMVLMIDTLYVCTSEVCQALSLVVSQLSSTYLSLQLVSTLTLHFTFKRSPGLNITYFV